MLQKNQSRNKDGTVKANKGIMKLGDGLFKARDDKINVRVLNSQQKSELFHFKVMQLRVHEDEPKGLSECKVRFHFFFELLKKKVRENSGEAKLSLFEWDVNSNPR